MPTPRSEKAIAIARKAVGNLCGKIKTWPLCGGKDGRLALEGRVECEDSIFEADIGMAAFVVNVKELGTFMCLKSLKARILALRVGHKTQCFALVTRQ